VIGALVADALCLGTHYEYDAVKIKQHLGGTIDRFMAPGEKMGGETHGVGWGKRNYHPGKTAGENTDYGDGNLFLLEYLAEHFPSGRTVPFSAQHYVEQHWLAQYNGWQTGKCRGCRAWVDTMTRTVLSNIARGLSVNQAGGMSNGQARAPCSARAAQPAKPARPGTRGLSPDPPHRPGRWFGSQARWLCTSTDPRLPCCRTSDAPCPPTPRRRRRRAAAERARRAQLGGGACERRAGVDRVHEPQPAADRGLGVLGPHGAPPLRDRALRGMLLRTNNKRLDLDRKDHQRSTSNVSAAALSAGGGARRRGA